MRTLCAVLITALGGACRSDAPPDEATAAVPALQQIVWVDRSGGVTQSVGEPQQAISGVEVSPDGARVVARGRVDDNDDIYLHDDESTTRFTEDEAHARHPMWTPSGESVAYFSYRNGPADLFIRPAGGSGEEAPLASGPMHEYYPDFTPDGAVFVFHQHDTDTDRRDLWTASVDGSTAPERLTDTPENESLPRFSPDGRYVAFQAEHDSAWNVYVTTFPRSDKLWQVSTNGGVWPKWSRDGEELFYFESNRLVSVTAATDDDGELVLGEPATLFETGSVGGWSAPEASLFNPLYGPSPDGSRFAIVTTR